MKVLTLKVDGKTYTTGKITAFMSSQAMKINKEALQIAKLGQSLVENPNDLDVAEQLMTEMDELNNRKAWIICEVYGNKFAQDDLQHELSNEEIDAEITKIIRGINGILTKN